MPAHLKPQSRAHHQREIADDSYWAGEGFGRAFVGQQESSYESGTEHRADGGAEESREPRAQSTDVSFQRGLDDGPKNSLR
jgi:hypothetical protein